MQIGAKLFALIEAELVQVLNFSNFQHMIT